MEGYFFLELGLLVVLILVTRILYVIHKIATGHSRIADRKRTAPAKTMICLGSGGHTTEMLTLLRSLDLRHKYTPRYYIVADNDQLSYDKAMKFESGKSLNKHFFIYRIPRSRMVLQSYFTSILSTFYSIVICIPYVVCTKPDLVLCNGPGSCVPICLASFLLKVGFIHDTRIVFVESFCRVQTFSLTGKILMYFADNILVQWPSLQKKLKRAEYIGQLM